jgi:hypothetical protein
MSPAPRQFAQFGAILHIAHRRERGFIVLQIKAEGPLEVGALI